jgi:hypothetical protein
MGRVNFPPNLVVMFGKVGVNVEKLREVQHQKIT